MAAVDRDVTLAPVMRKAATSFAGIVDAGNPEGLRNCCPPRIPASAT
jgi:hypothetical protein